MKQALVTLELGFPDDATADNARSLAEELTRQINDRLDVVVTLLDVHFNPTVERRPDEDSALGDIAKDASELIHVRMTRAGLAPWVAAIHIGRLEHRPDVGALIGSGALSSTFGALPFDPTPSTENLLELLAATVSVTGTVNRIKEKGLTFDLSPFIDGGDQ